MLGWMSGPLEVLYRSADALGLDVDEDSWIRVRELRGLWALYARSMNLVGPGQLDAQIVESLMLVSALRRLGAGLQGAWVDIGSGGGFPGLLVAVLEGGRGLLVEPRAKRSSFLELAAGRLGLAGWEVTRAHLEWGGLRKVEDGVVERLDDRVGSVRGCSARAVMGAEAWLELAACTMPKSAGQSVVSVHLQRGTTDPLGLVPEVVVELEGWSVRLYRLAAVRSCFT